MATQTKQHYRNKPEAHGGRCAQQKTGDGFTMGCKRRDIIDTTDEDVIGRLRQNSLILKDLSRDIRYGGASLKNIPALIKKIIREGIWKRHIEGIEIIEFDTFEEFVTTRLPEGLEATIDQIKALCSSDRETMQLIHAELGESYSPLQFTLNQIKSTLSPDEIRELVTLLTSAERNQKND